MMVEMSRIADKYGLDVWVWYPALDKDYTTEANIVKAVAEWEGVLKQLPRLDAIFVPGGDPGHTEPSAMFGLLDRQTANIRKFHPKMQMWMSPQGFTAPMDGDLLRAHGEATRLAHRHRHRPAEPRLARHRPQAHPPAVQAPPLSRHHAHDSRRVPGAALGRGLRAHARSRADQPAAARSGGGVPALAGGVARFPDLLRGLQRRPEQDRVERLGWNPKGDVRETVRQYARYFVGPTYAEPLSDAIFGLEENWRGPLAGNVGVERTLAKFQAMERTAAPRDLLNWRFQQTLYRAYYDAYVRRRLVQEQAAQVQATSVLANAAGLGSMAAMSEAERLLARPARRWPPTCGRACSSWPRRSTRACACSCRCRCIARSPSGVAPTSI